MKKIAVRRIVSVALILVVLGAFVSCASTIYQAYPGEPRVAKDTAGFSWPGTFMLGLMLFKVDGKPFAGEYQSPYIECSYMDFNAGGFSMTLLPGEHSFEFYTVDTDPLQFKSLRFTAEAGKSYVLKGDSKAFSVESDGKPVDSKIESVPVLSEPAQGQPNALLSLRQVDGRNILVFRVDGKIHPTMHKYHPRWATMTYVNQFGGVADSRNGELDLRLAPGQHTIEYVVDEFMFGGKALGRQIGKTVKSLVFNAEAGKKYSARVILDQKADKTGFNEHRMELLAN